MSPSQKIYQNNLNNISNIDMAESLIDFIIHLTISIINLLLKEGSFASLNNASTVCPIHKKDDMTKCTNDQPISLLSIISRIFDCIMYARLEDFLITSEILYK